MVVIVEMKESLGSMRQLLIYMGYDLSHPLSAPLMYSSAANSLEPRGLFSKTAPLLGSNAQRVERVGE